MKTVHIYEVKRNAKAILIGTVARCGHVNRADIKRKKQPSVVCGKCAMNLCKQFDELRAKHRFPHTLSAPL